MEELREKLENAIQMYGINDKRVLELSKKLDPKVCDAQKKYC